MSSYNKITAIFFISLATQYWLTAGPATCVPSNDCARRSISDDCDNSCSSCVIRNPTTYFKHRSITADLTYRNNMTFYERYHDAQDTWLTFDWTFLYQQNRKAPCIGLGFLGRNPLLVSENDGDINSLNLELGSRQPEGFSSLIRLSPKRKIFAWLPQFIANLDCCCTGLWADAAFAVVHARHEICLDEKVSTPGEVPGPEIVNPDFETEGRNTLVTVSDAFDTFNVFPDFRKFTAVDDIELRLGLDRNYRCQDHIGVYIVGNFPTGKKLDNTRIFQPTIGSRNWGVGFGITADATLWKNECKQSDLVLMTEFKYKHFFANTERRMFDLHNGPLSRFLLVAQENDRFAPSPGTTILGQCVHVKPGKTIDWWLALHYQACAWGFEGSYNLFTRGKECLSPRNFNLGDFGIFDMTRCTHLTSHSTALITDAFGQGTPDETFTQLKPSDINISSGAARRALSHTFAGTVSYNNIWKDCYPYCASLSARYELAARKYRTSTLENWGVFGKISISM